MNALLDTHVLLWFLAGDRRLSAAARKIFESTDNALLFSTVSAIEISLKFARGKLKLPQPPSDLIPRVISELGLLPLPIQIKHALQLSFLPQHHSDPFDRLLVAQAKYEDLPILTSDKLIRRYDVQIIW
jgi:PIN domain nuclease of toxin-antitoxin system